MIGHKDLIHDSILHTRVLKSHPVKHWACKDFSDEQPTRLIIDYLFFNHGWNFSPFILLIAQLWLKSCFANSILYGPVSKPVRRSRSTDHIFFDHDRTKIVGAGM